MATAPRDFRKDTDSFAALVKVQYDADACSGVLYVFQTKKVGRIKLVSWALACV